KQGIIKDWIYDPRGKPVVERMTDADGEVHARRLCYDPAGNLTHEFDTLGRRIFRGYNPWNAIELEATPATLDEQGCEEPSLSFYGRRRSGAIVQETSPSGERIQHRYNARQQVIFSEYPDGSEESFRYFLDGHLHSHTMRNGQTRVYERDCRGRVLSERLFTAGGTELSWRNCIYRGDCLIEESNSEGIHIHYEYDGAGRLVEMQTSDGSSLRTESYVYDSLGHRCKTLQGEKGCLGINIETFNVQGQVIERRKEDQQGSVLFIQQFAYDDAGNCTHTTSFDDEGLPSTVIKQYDCIGRLRRTIDPDGRETRSLFDRDQVDALGRSIWTETRIDHLGNKHILRLDVRDRVSREEWRDQMGVLTRAVDYLYDPRGNRTEERHAVIHCEGIAGHYTIRRSYSIDGLITEERRSADSGRELI
ncbi:MAG: RHS repeat protein, partial [Chlamydiia bacterium]|nr:RHS repeat protein [Chlamydiia bacterium]